jgi:monoamine oxidase
MTHPHHLLQRRRLLVQASAGALVALGVGVSRQARGQSAAAERADVIVLGAGLAGLAAAHALESAGARVQVLEAAVRVGGRIHTLDDLPGRPETGGQQIGAAYARTLAAVARLGLKLESNARSPLLRDERLVLHVQGRRRNLAQWATDADNPLPEAVRGLPPDRVLARLIGANPLGGIGAWRDPAHATHEVPVAGLLRDKGVSEAALRLLDVNNAFGDTLELTSLLNLYYTQANIAEIVKTPGPVQNIVGGNQRLPEAMAAALKTAPRLGERVVGIETSARGVQVRTAGGAQHRADFVVCTLPLPALRSVAVEPALPPVLADAVARAAYARVTQLHVAVKRPFWDDDGSSPYLWSDGPLERIFPQDRDGQGKPATLTVWINGAGTARWDALDDTGAAALLDAELATIWPGSRGAVQLLRRVSWHADALAGGAWINWSPGQISRYAGQLVQPAGRIHFAGEHTGLSIRGIEAAVSSGERAAAEVLARV